MCAPTATPRAAADRQTARAAASPPAWNPHATFALVTTSSNASSTSSNPSPRSALRSMLISAPTSCQPRTILTVSWPSRLSSADACAEHVAGPLVPNLNVRVSGATALVSPLFDPAANPFEQRTRQVSEIRWLGVATIERVRKRGREAPAETAATPPRPLAVAVLTESLRPAAALPATARAAATVAAKTSLEPTTRVYDAPRRPSLAPASLRARLDFVLPATLGSLESVSGGPTRRRTGRSRMTRSEERRVMAARVTSAGLLTLAMLVVTCV